MLGCTYGISQINAPPGGPLRQYLSPVYAFGEATCVSKDDLENALNGRRTSRGDREGRTIFWQHIRDEKSPSLSRVHMDMAAGELRDKNEVTG